MLTNTERQQIVEEVNAGTYGIDEALDDIAAAQKGEEVRKALYAEALVLNREGHAGSTDMIARQQIANLQTSVNGQISTLRTEVGEDIDDLETALNSGIATQNGKIAAQNATIANVVANYNVEYGSTELWASTGETGALAAGTTVTLSEDVSHFDYIDIYSFCGNSNVLDTVPVDAKLQSNAGYALRWVNLSDPGSGTYEAYVRIVETKIKIIGTTLTIVHQVTYRNGSSVTISGAEITQSNRSTYVGELGIMKVVGRKITANTEVEDIRTGADGTTYNSAGAAVRGQITEVKAQIPPIDASLATAGKAADAKAVGDELAGLNGRLDEIGDGGLNARAKAALLNCFNAVWWATGESTELLEELTSALYSNYVAVTGMTLDAGSITVETGSSVKLTPTIRPANATVKSITWKSSNTSVATVDENGNVTGVSEGSCVISAKTVDGGYTDTCSVSVARAVITYTITNTLSNCLNSNDAVSITENSSYTGALTPDTDYRLTSVVITMGGTDITSTVYSNGNISIPAVTGNVIITATATAIGNIFEGKNINTGYMVNANTGAVSASNNKFVTDLIDVSAYVGDVIFVDCVGGTPSTGGNNEYRVVFYDSSEAFISSLYCNPTKLSVVIPSNAKYMRVGGLSSTLTGINAYVAKNAISESEVDVGYYNLEDGVKVSDNSYRCKKIDVPVGKFYIKNIFSICTFDENDSRTGQKPSLSSQSYVNFSAEEKYAGINIQTSNISTAEICTDVDYLIGLITV